MRTEDVGRYQMLWDCPFCGTEKLLGLDHRHCPSCGGAQDPDKRYYPPEGEEIAVEDHPFHGADRECPNCSTPNSAQATFCGNCGSPLDEAAAVKRKADQRPDDPPPPPEPDPAKGGGGKGSRKGCAFFVVVLLFVGFAAFCLMSTFWKKDASVTVTGHSWTRSITVEKQGTATASAWKESVPKDATNIVCKKEQQSTKKVESGEECKTVRKDKGDGTYDKVKECSPTYKDEPVYGQKCSYRTQKWTTARTEKAQGNSTGDRIAWPQLKLQSGERQGARTETYVVKFKVDGSDSGSCDTNQQRWATLEDGSTWNGKISVISSSIDCDSLTRK
ncbi:MAG: zinc ribbon domain-containing protein [Oligoflexia bacterium]|nr:zinc ribbon domain-containing protein [Oligoflexia bacterium]